MRYIDEQEAKRLNAEPWMLDLLKVNPDYLGWGPFEDYMWKEGSGWDSRVIVPTWEEFGPWDLDCLNECVNFYFSVSRPSTECTACGGNGYHPEGQRIVNTFYPHQCDEIGAPRSEAWNNKITEDEAEALIASGRAKAGETAETINSAQHRGAFMGHDAINRGILIRARIKRLLGLDDHRCPHCEGWGAVFTEPNANLSLTLWWLHPRKGCSRGIEITKVERSDLSSVREFLLEAASRNADRFKGISKIGAVNASKEQA